MIGTFLLVIYVYHEGSAARKKGEGFEADEKTIKILAEAEKLGDGVNPILALVPIIVIIVLLVAAKMNAHIALLIGSILCAVLFHKNLKLSGIQDLLVAAIGSGTNAVITTGCIVGYGTVVSASAGYAILSDALIHMGGNPLVSFGIATTVLAGAAGSGTGGLAIAMSNIAPEYIAMGVNPEVLHRIGTMAATGLDSLPHSGAVVVLLTLCGMTHKDSYKQIFVTTVVITLIVAFIGIAIGSVMYPIG